MAYDFASLKLRVMDRMILQSSTADTRVGKFLNERYRRVATSIGLQPVRFGSENIVTVNGVSDYTTVNMIHMQTMTYPAGNRIIGEITMDAVRNLDPAGTRTGAPEYRVTKNFQNTNVKVTIWPKPDAAYTLPCDGILRGTELVAANDTPVIPEDFEDVLVFGACADELMKQEKDASRMEQQYEKRLSDLRYFIAKTAYLELQQGQYGQWWWGPWFHNYRGFWY